MASKRNSRVFQDEATESHHKQQKHHATSHSYRPRRNSHNASKEDTAEMQEEKMPHDSTPVNISHAPSSNKDTTSSNMTVNRLQSKESKDKLQSVSPTTTDSEPTPPPTEDRPHNFGLVIPGVYRSSYPKAEHFRFIKELKLKTMVTLVKKDELDRELMSFVDANNIHQIIFNMKGTKKEAIPPATMRSILEVVTDSRNYPLLIHCNHGKHRTGCVVAAVRKMEGWSVESCLDEYTSYAQPKIRDCDLDYIRDFKLSDIQEHGLVSPRFTPKQVGAMFRTLLFTAMVLGIWIVSGCHIMAYRNRAMGN